MPQLDLNHLKNKKQKFSKSLSKKSKYSNIYCLNSRYTFLNDRQNTRYTNLKRKKKAEFEKGIDYGKRAILFTCGLIIVARAINYVFRLFNSIYYFNTATNTVNCDTGYAYGQKIITNEEQIKEIIEITNVIRNSPIVQCLEQKHIDVLTREAYCFRHPEIKKYANRFKRLPYLIKLLEGMHERMNKGNVDKSILKIRKAKLFFGHEILEVLDKHAIVSIDNPIMTIIDGESCIKMPQENLLNRIDPPFEPRIIRDIKQGFLRLIQGKNYVKKPEDARDPSYIPPEVHIMHPRYDLVQFQKNHCEYSLILMKIFHHLPIFYETTIKLTETERKERIESRKIRKETTGREIEIEPAVEKWVTKKMKNKATFLDDWELELHYIEKHFMENLQRERDELIHYAQLMKKFVKHYGKEIYELTTEELEGFFDGPVSKEMMAYIESLRPKSFAEEEEETPEE